MGKIDKARLLGIPQGATADEQLYRRRIAQALVQAGAAAIATPDSQPASAFEDAITTFIGSIIAAEIAADPQDQGYSGKTNAQIAQMLNDPFQKVSANLKRRAIDILAGSTAGSYGTTAINNVYPKVLCKAADIVDFVNGCDANSPPQLYTWKFTNNTPTVALQGLRRSIVRVEADGIVLSEPLPVAPTAADKARLLYHFLGASRWTELCNGGMPHAPAELTAADIAAALAP